MLVVEFDRCLKEISPDYRQLVHESAEMDKDIERMVFQTEGSGRVANT